MNTIRMLVLANMLAVSSLQAAEPVRIATHDQAPYGTYAPDGSFDGVAVKVMKCVFKRMKRDVSIEVFPWARAQYMAENSEVDGFFPATMKPERLVWAEASEVIADQKWVWYLPAANKLEPGSADFKSSAKVGAHLGSNRLKMLEDEKFNVVAKPPTDEQLLLMLASGRVDAILGGNLSIADAMKTRKIDSAKFRAVVERDNPLHAYFGRKFLQNEPEFMKRFNAQVAACR
jgi:polar amino acid transport system substrate-binding protein